MNDLIPGSEVDPLPIPEPTGPAGGGETPAISTETGSRSVPTIMFQGNSYDLLSVVGVTVGGVVLLSCATCNFGFYCLPFIPIILGVIGLAGAKDSVDPERTKLLSWISLGSGGAILLLILLFGVAYIGLIAFAIAADGSGGF